MRRRSIIPFFAGSQRITSLEEFKQVLSDKPSELIEPLKDGRVERFLDGISPMYAEFIDPANPQESLKKLAEELGVEIKGEIKEITTETITSEDELLKTVENKRETILLGRGEFYLNNFEIDYPVKFVGRGKNETYLKVDKFTLFDEATFENMSCESEQCIATNEHKTVNAEFSAKELLWLVKTEEDLIQAIENKKRGILLESGEFSLDELNIDYPFVIAGISKEKTLLKIKTLNSSSSILFKNITCEAQYCTIKEYKTENADFKFTIEVERIKNKKIKVTKDVIIENKLMEYQNTEFIFENNAKIIFRNCSCNIQGCKFFNNNEKELEAQTKEQFLNSINQHRLGDIPVSCMAFENSELNIADSEFTMPNGAGIVLLNGKAEIRKSLFENPSLTNILSVGDGNLYIIECRFEENESNIVLYENPRANIENCKFEENESNNINIILFGDSTADIEGCEFIRNKKSINILGDDSSKATVKFCKFEENEESNNINLKENSTADIVSCEFKFAKGEKCPSLWGEGSSKFIIKSCKFGENEGTNVYLKGNSTADIVGCEFIRNKNTSLWGEGSSKLTVKLCRFEGNEGNNIVLQENSTANIEDCGFVKNKDISIWGGGSSKLTVKSCRFEGNESGNIYLKENSTANIENCDFVKSGNAAYYSLSAHDNAFLSLYNCRFKESNSNIRVEGATIKVFNSSLENISILIKSTTASSMLKNSTIAEVKYSGTEPKIENCKIGNIWKMGFFEKLLT